MAGAGTGFTRLMRHGAWMSVHQLHISQCIPPGLRPKGGPVSLRPVTLRSLGVAPRPLVGPASLGAPVMCGRVRGWGFQVSPVLGYKDGLCKCWWDFQVTEGPGPGQAVVGTQSAGVGRTWPPALYCSWGICVWLLP